jgi:hypothetical protein
VRDDEEVETAAPERSAEEDSEVWDVLENVVVDIIALLVAWDVDIWDVLEDNVDDAAALSVPLNMTN